MTSSGLGNLINDRFDEFRIGMLINKHDRGRETNLEGLGRKEKNDKNSQKRHQKVKINSLA